MWGAPLIFLTENIGVQPILPIKVSITSAIMLNIDGDLYGYATGDVICKPIW